MTQEQKDAYYEALRKCSDRYLDLTEYLPNEEMHPENHWTLRNFIFEFQRAIETREPLMKLNRWLGYIQGYIIAHGITNVNAERDWTRPLFRPLDFP